MPGTENSDRLFPVLASLTVVILLFEPVSMFSLNG